MHDEHELARPKELGAVQHIIGHIIIAVLIIFIFGLAVMWLWNGLLPGLFGVKLIHYWQALGLVILARLLFGSFGFGLGASASILPAFPAAPETFSWKLGGL